MKVTAVVIVRLGVGAGLSNRYRPGVDPFAEADPEVLTAAKFLSASGGANDPQFNNAIADMPGGKK